MANTFCEKFNMDINFTKLHFMKKLNLISKLLILGMCILGIGAVNLQGQYSQYATMDAVASQYQPDATASDLHGSNIFIGQNAAADSATVAYVQFDLTGLSGRVVESVAFSTRSDMQDGKTMTVKLTEANDGFARDTTNWNNKPGTKTTTLATVVMDQESNRKIYTENGTNLVNYINTKLQSGATKVSFALKYSEGDGTALKWCGGKGDGSYGPLLEMTFASEAAYYASADAVASQYQPDATANDLHGSNIFIGQNAAADSATVAYVQFNLAGMAFRQVGEATFSTRSDVQDGKTMTVKLTGSNDNIDRATTTWNTKPTSSNAELAAVVMDQESNRKVYTETGTALVDYINAQLAMGDELITFALKYKEGDGTALKWCGGKGDGSYGPELRLGKVSPLAAAYSSYALDDAVAWQKQPDQVAGDAHASNIFIGQNAAADSNVFAFVKFSLEGLAGRTVTKADFSTRSDMQDGKTMTVKLTEAGDGFSRDTTNWNNKPSTKTATLASVVMDQESNRKMFTENGTNLITYINGKLMSGATQVSFALKYSEGDGTALKWCGGKGDGSYGPMLELEFSDESGFYATADAVAAQRQPDATANDLHGTNIFIGQNAAADSATVAYVQFELAGLAYSEIESVEFSTRSDMQDGKTMTVKVNGSNDDIDRATTTWNTKPTSANTELATVVMDQESNRKVYVETGTAFVDYINSQLAVGDETITLALKYKDGDGTALKWCGGKGDGAYGPMLVVKSPSLTPEKDTIGIMEDVYVDEADPDANKDGSSDMGIRLADDGTGREVYLKFDISEVSDEIVGNATLRLYIAQHNSGTQRDNFYADLFVVEDQTWSETSLTWNTKPEAGMKLLTENVTWYNAGKDTTWTSANLTHYLNEAIAAGKTTITFAIKGKDVTNGDRLWMAESNWKPSATQLILDYTVEPPEKVAPVVADSYVDQGNPDVNYGTEADQHLINDDANNLSKWVYQKFDISTAYEGVISATLKLYARVHSSATEISTFDFVVYGVDDNSWLEEGITWNNKPAGGTMMFGGTAVPEGGWFNLSSAAFTDFVNAAIDAGKDSLSVVIKGKNETPGQRAWISGREYKVPELILNYEKQAQQPMFTPAPGEFIKDVDVTISTLTTGATIYYTTDGTDPDETSTVYSAPLNLAETTILKAIAVAPDLKASPVAMGTYLVTPVGLPEFSPSAVPKYQPPVEVTITVVPDDAVIRYSDDGSEPSTLYTEAIVLNQTTTLKAQAFSADFSYSTEVVEITYTIVPPTGTAGTGPGGIGYKDLSRSGQPELGLWLRPEALSGLNDGDNILTWTDASGNQNDAYNSWVDGGDNAIPNTNEQQKEPPVVDADGLNGLPIAVMGASEGNVASLIVDDADNLDGGEGQSIYMIMKRNHLLGDFAALFQKRDIRGSDPARQAYTLEMNGGGDPNTIQHVLARDLFLRSDRTFNADDYYLLNVGLNGTMGLAFFNINGAEEKTASYDNPVQAVDATVIIGGFQPMNLAELVYFNSTLNAAQTVIIHQYLAAKYGMSLESGNLYTHADYTFDLIGIGKETDLAGSADEEHLHSTGGALELKADAMATAGDYVFAAHNGVDITEDENKVWSRIWNVETAGNGGNVEMIFDFAKAGLTLSSADGYLLAHSTDLENWTDLEITPSKDGDKLVFSVPAIAEGYYAVGQDLPGKVGIDLERISKGFTLYPNPATELVHLSFTDQAMGNVTVSVIDFTGRTVSTMSEYKGTGTFVTEFDVSGLESGMYMIELKINDSRSLQPLVVR